MCRASNGKCSCCCSNSLSLLSADGTDSPDGGSLRGLPRGGPRPHLQGESSTSYTWTWIPDTLTPCMYVGVNASEQSMIDDV